MTQKPKIVILKIGSFMKPEGDTSSIGLITGEPMNFASQLVSKFGDKYDICLGSDYYHYDPETKFQYFNLETNGRGFVQNNLVEGSIVLIWQGGYIHKEHTSLVTSHYEFINELQKQSDSEYIRQYFMLTDTRVQLLDIVSFMNNKAIEVLNFDEEKLLELEPFFKDTSRFKIDSKQITMLTQAKNTEVLKKDFMCGTVECQKEYYGFAYREYKEILHFSMHTMPLLTHQIDSRSLLSPSQENTPKHDLIFTVQSIGYFNDYRMRRFIELVCNREVTSNYDVAVYGKHNRLSFEKLFDFLEVNDTTGGHGTANLPKMLGAVKFGEMKYIINKAKYNMCISEAAYIKYDLLPNRIFESFATGTIPLIDQDILNNTDHDLFHLLMKKHHKFIVSDSKDVVDALYNYPNTREISDFDIDVSVFNEHTITKFYSELDELFS